MWAIIKKEVKSYFLSPIGYIFVGLFLAVYSIFFYLDVYVYGTTNFGNMFYSLTTIVTFLVPVLTMRLFAEEKKNGTEQLILTSPRSVTAITLGKFFAALIVVLISELLTFIYFGILMYFGSPNLVTALVTLLGFTLLCSSYIAFGMFASSLTENQIIAEILTTVVLLVLWFTPNFIPSMQTFSLVNAFTSSFPAGTISLASLVLLGSFTVIFILLTMMVLQRKKNLK